MSGYCFDGCRTYEEVADKVGLKGEQRHKYIRYMTLRWWTEELTHCLTGYAGEWAIRFYNGTEYEASDSVGQAILRQLSEREQ